MIKLAEPTATAIRTIATHNLSVCQQLMHLASDINANTLPASAIRLHVALETALNMLHVEEAHTEAAKLTRHLQTASYWNYHSTDWLMANCGLNF